MTRRQHDPGLAGGLTDQHWKEYRANGNPVSRTALLETYLGLVHYCAQQLTPSLPPHIERDDMVSAGTLGLVHALEHFDLDRGLAFSTYAMPRIRGAMVDELRAREWLPRTARRRRRMVLEARERAGQRLGRSPDLNEVAEEMGVAPEELRRWEQDLDIGKPVDIGGSRDGKSDLELADEQVADPLDGMTRQSRKDALREAIAALPEKQRLVISLSYLEEINLKQIGELLHITESRVSQIRAQAIQKLKQALKENDA
jgi:RNA polymerase sigma factor for flagellar operon FliA